MSTGASDSAMHQEPTGMTGFAGQRGEAARGVAIFAAGCFWGVQYYFDQVPGVIETTAGYTGGHTDNPTYEQVCSHTTGHAESVKIEYDPAKVVEGAKASTVQGAGEQQSKAYKKYGERVAEPATKQSTASDGGVGGFADEQAEAFRILLKQFFRMHDPTQLNRQGPDVGDSYRSAIFYTSEAQKVEAQKMIEKLNKEKLDNKIVTELKAATKFWPAEDYHQKFTQKTGQGMCHVPYTAA